MIVTDCSALLGFLIDPAGAPTFSAAIANASIVAAPDLIDVELLSALRHLERLKSFKSAAAIVEGHLAMPLARYSTRDMARDIWALRNKFSAYDASYIALARILKAPLMTRDGKLQRAGANLANIILI